MLEYATTSSQEAFTVGVSRTFQQGSNTHPSISWQPNTPRPVPVVPGAQLHSTYRVTASVV